MKIPARLNLALCLAAPAVAAALLYAAAHRTSLWQLAAAAVAFSFVGNTIFSLMHEAVHGILHPKRRVNELLGVWCAAFFPTGFTFQRFCHLGHHARNRTDAEMFDLYYESDSRLLKKLQFYGIFTGPYWLLPPLGSLVVLFWPEFYRSRAFGRLAKDLEQTGVSEMVRGFLAAPQRLRMRLEILFSCAVQAALILGLDLDPAAYFVCHFAFGVNWGALQYADHAFSPRDVVHGAWNLRVPAPVRWLFLNYHHHLAHHRHPDVPWIYLGRCIDPREPRPTFWSIYRRMWRGPVLATEPCPLKRLRAP